MCLALVVTWGCSKGLDRSKFESVHKSARQVEASTQAGVSKEEFGRLVKHFAFELAAVQKGPLNEIEKRLCDVYEEAVLTYDESYGFWDTGYREFHPEEREGLAAVAARYGVPTEPVQDEAVIKRYENNLKWMKFDVLEAKGLMDDERSRTGQGSRSYEEARENYERKLRAYEEYRDTREHYVNRARQHVRMDGDRARDRMWVHASSVLRKAYRLQETGGIE